MADVHGTKANPWALKTPPGTSEYTMYRDEQADPPVLVCQVGSTTLKYQLRAIDDLHAWLLQQHSINVAENDHHLAAFRSIAQEYPLASLRWSLIHLQSIDAARLKALIDLGISETHVIEFAPRLMPRQIDSAGSAMLQSKLKQLGLTQLARVVPTLVEEARQQQLSYEAFLRQALEAEIHGRQQRALERRLMRTRP